MISISKHRQCLRDRYFRIALIGGILLLAGSMFVNFYAGMYAAESASNSVTDIILSNIPVFDLDVVFLYGPAIFWVIIFCLQLSKPERFPFVLKAIALFVLVRSAFITLTHIGPFPSALPMDLTGVIGYFTFGADLFFSGHAGLPFLAALIFWQDKALRYFCLAAAVFFGATVLMAHLHYSIDVLSAFFITYAIFHLAEWLFRKDRKMFKFGLNQP